MPRPNKQQRLETAAKFYEEERCKIETALFRSPGPRLSPQELLDYLRSKDLLRKADKHVRYMSSKKDGGFYPKEQQ